MWEWLTQNAPQLNVLVTSIYTVLTGVVVFLMWRSTEQMRDSIKQTQNAEISRSRPYVVILLEHGRSGMITLRVKNIGPTPAKNLTMSSNPEIRPVRATGSVQQFGQLPDHIGLFRHPITYLAPGGEIEALVGHYTGLRDTYPDLVFDITLRYDGIGGPHEETLRLSCKPTDNTLRLQQYDPHEELHNIASNIGAIEKKISR